LAEHPTVVAAVRSELEARAANRDGRAARVSELQDRISEVNADVQWIMSMGRLSGMGHEAARKKIELHEATLLELETQLQHALSGASAEVPSTEFAAAAHNFADLYAMANSVDRKRLLRGLVFRIELGPGCLSLQLRRPP
jgi:hypothetical protein